ncbi:hypothetical protein C8R44DRAFT_742903 [Mycena epipterygia]|nr:hypothetical protein C8R44DRAFT_742903 [Mycena epipterygia]
MSAIDPRTLVKNIVSILELRLERIMCDTLEFNFKKMQAAFLPAEPAPEYTQDQVRPISDIKPHASRLRELKKFIGNKGEFRHPEQAVFVEKMILRDGHILLVLSCII